jgi:biotin-(acetyl-CoA carboxylase) ligase
MPRERRGRTQEPYRQALDLPPPFRLKRLREAGDAFAHACANAVSLGAGTLVLVSRFNLVEFAVVLEPDEPLATARRAFYAGMVALGNALSASAPPEKPIAIEWPDAVLVDGGLVGGGRLAWPERSREDAVPRWLVFGTTIRTVAMTGVEAGLHPLATALEDEGFGEAASERLTEGFARHLMLAVDRWHEAGFAAVGAEYLAKLRRENGTRCDLDERGDLLVMRSGRAAERRALRPMLERPSWLDQESGEARLSTARGESG